MHLLHRDSCFKRIQQDPGLIPPRKARISTDGFRDYTGPVFQIPFFDYPGNDGFPGAWRVDEQFGFGPNRSWQEWKMEKDQIETLRYRLIAYTGNFDASKVEDAYKAFAVVK